MTQIPIPADTAQVFRSGGSQCRNFGLMFDRFIGFDDGWTLEGSRKHDEAAELVKRCNEWARDPAYRRVYEALRVRQEKMMISAGGRSFTAAPEWRLVIGLGRDSALETGLTLHRVYGFPFVPGSSLKGMALAWAHATQQPAPDIRAVFGEQDEKQAACAGEITFFDALPVTPPQLKLDVMNPHYPDYYRPGDRKPPADWQSPVPVYFITIEKSTRFIFGVGQRKRQTQLLDTARTWLQSALQDLGVGGKTTSGYGYWTEFREATIGG